MKLCKKCKINPIRRKSEYCSKECSKRLIQRKIDLKCSHCNKKFQKYPSQVKDNKDTIFCGNECVTAYRKIHWKSKIKRDCINCNKEFEVHQSELKKSKNAGSYCSRECISLGKSFIQKCLICNKPYKVHLSNKKRSNPRFCSKKCYDSRTDPKEHFFKSISKRKHKYNCWIWKGRKDKDGYGILYIKKNVKAHRYSWELKNGRIPEGFILCHKCDNTSCVNPDHLYIGTHLDNARDRINKENKNYYELLK